jgi:hypothetical protein
MNVDIRLDCLRTDGGSASRHVRADVTDRWQLSHMFHAHAHMCEVNNIKLIGWSRTHIIIITTQKATACYDWQGLCLRNICNAAYAPNVAVATRRGQCDTIFTCTCH